MLLVFAKLPLDLIKYEILPFDKHFIIRKGKLITINSIENDDYRYKILKNITIKKEKSYIICNNHKRYEYSFNGNLYNSIERKERKIDDDILEVTMCLCENGNIEYNIIIFRMKPIHYVNKYYSNKFWYVPNYTGYCWYYVHYHYIRQ
jgi:hypothetical protein